MKYLTKQWYMTMQDSGLGVCLEADERAAVYSEELYQTLRAQKLEAWLREQEEVCEILSEPYDEEQERRSFDECVARELELYRTRTPARILSRVADPRLLALGFSTDEIRRDFEAFRQQCERRTEETTAAAWKAQKAAGLDKVWTGERSLHDSVIESVRWEGEDLILEFERDEVEWPEIKAIRFHDARILVQEKAPENAWWLYDEIYRSERGYEIHVLLWDSDLFELTVDCADAELVWTM